MWSRLFQLGGPPSDELIGHFNLKLVALSYVVAFAASYIALDMTSRLKDNNNTKLSTTLWLIGGSFAMGCGIWSMHFIGMLALQMPIPMNYSTTLTVGSLVVAILASFFALFLLKSRKITTLRLWVGGVILGLAISAMHYIGMAAVEISVNVHYLPTLFFLSIIIGIIASEVAIWLALKSSKGSHAFRNYLKLLSALIMGAAICGMHYTGMAAAVFTPPSMTNHSVQALDPQWIAINVAIVTFFILSLAFSASAYKEVLNEHVIKMAREKGMAEVAADVLHNVGNALNSVNISANLILNHNEDSPLISLIEVSNWLKQHQMDFQTFIRDNNRGKNLPTYLTELADCWQSEQSMIQQEIQRLIDKIEYIKNVVRMQQNLCTSSTQLNDAIMLDRVVEDALLLTSIDFTSYHIKIEKSFKKIAPISIDRLKLIQILVNLINNAKDSLLAVSESCRRLILTINLSGEDMVSIEVKDTGIGISSGDVTKLFSRNFTTKKDGHGFGLHASAMATEEMGGVLQAASAGRGEGATFTLTLPYKMTEKDKEA